MSKYTKRAKANQPETGHFNPHMAEVVDAPVMLSPGLRHITNVDVKLFYEKDSGKLRDRAITVELECSHVKNVSLLPLSELLPEVGECTRCLRVECNVAEQSGGKA